MPENDAPRANRVSGGTGYDLAYYEKRRSDCLARAASNADPAVAARYREFAQLYSDLIEGAPPRFMSDNPG